MSRLNPAAILSLMFLAAFAGCAPKQTPPIERIYVGLTEKPGTFPAKVLEGKRIVIDPGHGGAFDGALGADSLREADANLGVALYLWGLCADAGADVQLTRSADRDLLPPGSVELADDLRARVARANELEMDVFLSIHHNSNLRIDRSLNRIEVYYRSSDTGPSLELAQAIQVHLSRNLGIGHAEVKPGNYFVLRNSDAHAAVLGEASYLSHPLVEDRLRLAEKQKLEAQAYFLALIDYFSRGVPVITRLAPGTDTVAAPVEIAFAAGGTAGIPLDPLSARIRIGAAEVMPHCESDSATIRWPMDAELPNGPYRIQATVRSMGGATGRSIPYTIVLNRPARHIIPLLPRPSFADSVALSLRVLDELGLPVADGTPAALSPFRNEKIISGTCRAGTATFVLSNDDADDRFIVSVGAHSDTIRFPPSDVHDRIPVLAVDAGTNEPIPTPVACGRTFGSIRGDRDGVLLIPIESISERITVTARGYHAENIDSLRTDSGKRGKPFGIIRLAPIFNGALAGRRVAIDPGGGGSDAGGFGAGGLRGASVNLSLAKALRDLLERAGANVVLTREGEETLSAEERIYIVNRSGAELALGIRCGAPAGAFDGSRIALHYPGSARGAHAADSIAAVLAALPPGGAFRVGESADLFLQQTSCAAVEVYCGAIENEAAERNMEDSYWIRTAAELMCATIARWFATADPQ